MPERIIRIKVTPNEKWRVTTIEVQRRGSHVESIETYMDFKKALREGLKKQRMKYSEIVVKF